MSSKLVSCLVALVAAALHFTPTLAQVQLKSRTLQPSAKTTAEFDQAVKTSATGFKHGLAVFTRHPSPDERKTLEAAGLRVLSPLQGLSYRVRVEKHFNPAALKVPDLQVALMALEPGDRVEPAIWRGDLARYRVTPPGAKPLNYVLNADGTLTVFVRMHLGIAEADSRAVLNKHATSYRRQSDQTWVAIMPRAAVQTLAAEDSVQWVDAGPLPFLPENDNTRALLNVDSLQNFDVTTGQVLGLGGNGVQVAIFDKGIDETHGDFAGRIVGDPLLTHTHGTHLAGTVAGSGVLSTGTDSWGRSNGLVAYRWRGMAPRAGLIDGDQTLAADTSRYLDYIQNRGMDLSLHSYKFAFDGNYDEGNQLRDSLVRGDASSSTTPVPGRLQVVSSGNEGLVPQYGGNQTGYFALTKQVKNGLMVGHWDSNNNRIANTSSLGPAHDGRIKPDVLAPGNAVISTGYCSPSDTTLSYCERTPGNFAERHNFYRPGTGTSMAAAAVAGTIALVLEQYASTYSANLDLAPPLPSTLRALMIHTAVDKHTITPWPPNSDGEVKPGVGPDFVTGWGLIDAQAAVSAVANRRLTENTMQATCHTKTFLFHVPAGTAPLRATLAWDDVAADAATPITAPKLINDLDLILVAPGGGQYYSWKLDQEIRNSANNVIPDAAQQCGTAITVGRTFMPIADPSAGNDPIPATGVPVAVRGRDHLNNVEVVDTPAAAQPGIWLAKVIGFNVAEGPQKFSLVGRNFQPFHIHPTSLCPAFPALCRKLSLSVDLCERFPRLCDPGFSFPGQDRVRVQFTERRQKIVLPLDATCRLALNCPPCASDRSCRSYNMEIDNPVPALSAAIYTSSGDSVTLAITGSGASRRAQFAATRGERYFAVLAPGPTARLATDYDVKLRMW